MKHPATYVILLSCFLAGLIVSNVADEYFPYGGSHADEEKNIPVVFSKDIVVENVTVGIGSGGLKTNTVVGESALSNNVEGIQNTAVGFNALFSNTTGDSNVALGQEALYFNTNGWANIAIGSVSLYANTEGKYNVALGVESLKHNTDGSYNTAINYDSLFHNTTGSGNTSIGYVSMYNNTSGEENVAIGFGAGFGYDGTGNITGSKNVWLGYQAGPYQNADLSNSIAIGHQARNTESDQVVIGNENTQNTVLKGKISIGGGTPLQSIKSVTKMLDFPSSNPEVVNDIIVEFEGAEPGDLVTLGIPREAVTKTGMYQAWVTENNKVAIRFSAKDVEDPLPGLFRLVLTKF